MFVKGGKIRNNYCTLIKIRGTYYKGAWSQVK